MNGTAYGVGEQREVTTHVADRERLAGNLPALAARAFQIAPRHAIDLGDRRAPDRGRDVERRIHPARTFKSG
jgi:hypothetical protein